LPAAIWSDLSRREFLERTAWTAGLAGTAGLPASTLLAEAAEASLRSSQQAHASDLQQLEEVADRFGAPVYEGKLGDIFALPDTVARAVRARPR
jgi:hypothetical protein